MKQVVIIDGVEYTPKIKESSVSHDYPLLTYASPGDLCLRRTGIYSEFHSKHKLHDNTIRYYLADCLGSTDVYGKCEDNLITENDIIHYEPLAPRGTMKWAGQKMLLGYTVTKDIYYIYFIKDGIVMYKTLESGDTSIAVTSDPFKWTSNDENWKIYTPALKPNFGVKPGDYVEIYGNQYLITGKPYIEDNDWLCNNIFGNQEKYHESDITRVLSSFEVEVNFGFGRYLIYQTPVDEPNWVRIRRRHYNGNSLDGSRINITENGHIYYDVGRISIPQIQNTNTVKIIQSLLLKQHGEYNE